MDFAELSGIVLTKLPERLQTNPGVAAMAAHRTEIDGWLLSELLGVLVEAGCRPEPRPDKERLDVVFGKWGLDVRSLVTNMPCAAAKDRTQSIKKTISDMTKEIWKLTNPGKTSRKNRALVFAAYPAEHDNERWQSVFLRQIATELTKLEYTSFTFSNGVPGILYLGLCTEVV
ncbi:MAG: hypothetical protein ABIE70_09885 [bacterium]